LRVFVSLALVLSALTVACEDPQQLEGPISNLPPYEGSGPGPCTLESARAARPAGKQWLVIATGGTGGVFFPYGGGLARVLSERLADTRVTAEVTGGSVDNNKLIFVNEVDLAFSTSDSAYDALQGTGPYADTGPIALCAVASLYQSFLHVVSLDDPAIRGVADLRGRRVSIGSAGSSTESVAERVLRAAGLDPQRDVTRDNLSVAESVNAMKDGKIDAFFWIGGLPTAAVTDLVTTPGVRVRFLATDAYVTRLREEHGNVYVPAEIPAGTYTGVDAPVPGIGVGNVLAVAASASPEWVEAVLSALLANVEEVRAIHPEARGFGVESASAASAIPYHPGALAFYRKHSAGAAPGVESP